MLPRSRLLQHAHALSLPLALAIAGMLGTACDTSLGVVGSAGLTASGTFTGITNANILSPSSVKVTWNTSSAYKTYSVYSSSSPFPLGNTIFSSFTMTGLTPATDYSFSVGGVAASGSIDGLNQVQSLTTWPQFIGLTTLTATSPISLQASWTFNDPTGSPITGPNFSVYVSQDTPPTDFTSPVASTNSTTIGITQLSDGSPILANATYFVIVRATYLDGTGEFNQNALSVKTPSNISPLPTIITDPVIIGSWPTLTVSGALASYNTSFKLVTYPNGPTGPTGGQNLGSVLGSNSFKTPSSQPIAWGQNTIIPIVTSQGSSVSLPPVTVTSRSFNSTMADFPAFNAVTGPSGNLQARGFQQLGTAMAVGDFNCDGYQDLAVSAAYATMNPLFNQGTYDGGVYVFYGSSQGLITSPAPSTNPSTSTAPLLLTRPPLTAQSGNMYFGMSLAAGNINGDTNTANGKACDDLAVGTWNSLGETWVFFGGTTGLQFAGAPVDQSAACSGTSCSPLRITPPAGSYTVAPYLGASLSIGRLHQPLGGDTYRDLIIGGPGEHVAGKGLGSAWIFYGGTQGINFSTPYTKLLPPVDAGTQAQWWSMNFGLAVTTLDMDGDGIDDIVVGAPTENVSTNCSGAGAIFYYPSATNTVSSTGYPATATSTMISNPLNRPVAGCTSYVRFGGNLANAGDINGDGHQDLLVADGITQAAGISGSATYGVTVYYGSSSGPQTTHGCGSLKNLQGNSSPACATNVTASCGAAASLGAGQCMVLNIPYAAGAAPGNYLTVTAAGASANGQMQDVNNDGYADIMVGWPFGGYSEAVQRSDVYYGGPNGIQASFSKILPLVTGTYDDFGWGVALGNFNGDLYSDAAGAAPSNMTLNGPWGGVVLEYNGQSGGFASNVTSYTKALTPNVSKEGSGAGYAVSVGDVNGDGFTDVAAIISRPVVPAISVYPYYGQTDMVIYYGSAAGLVTNVIPVLLPLHATDPLLVPPATGPNPNFTFVGAAGDVNGDGFADVAAGNTGTMFLYYGSSSGLQVAVAPSAPPTTGLNALIIGSTDGTSSYIVNTDAWAWVGSNNAIGSGDFNGDGYSDIILGAGSSFINVTPTTPGSALVIYGGAQGLQTDGILQRTQTGGPDVVLTSPCTGTAPNLICKAQLLIAKDSYYFGNNVSGVGDVNKDGFGDAVVSSPENNYWGATNGVIYLYMGSPSGLLMWDSATKTYDNNNGSSTGLIITPPLISNGAMTGRLFGRAGVSPAGDVNGDGFADFIAASMYEYATIGGTFLFYGCGNGLNNSVVTTGCPSTGLWGIPAPPAVAAINSVVVNQPSCTASGCSLLFFYPNYASVIAIGGAWTGNYWGMWGGGVGDVNKDGYSDVLQGTTSFNQYCTSTACANYYDTTGGGVLYTGSATGLTVNLPVTRTPSCNGGVCTPYWVTPSMTGWGVTETSFHSYGSGATFNNTTPADFNGDGFPDFMITSGAFTNLNQTLSFRGGMYFFQ